jgi:sugar phosphate isomerase/epimerase
MMRERNIFINVPYELVEPNVKRIVSMDVGIEIYLENNLIEDIGEHQVGDLAKKLKDNGIDCTCHAPYMDLSPGGKDRKVRQITVEKLKRSLELAQILEAKNLVCHTGFSKWYFDGNVDLWFKNSVLTWTEVLKEKEESLSLVIENVFEDAPDPLIELIKYFKGKLFFCFDTGHFNIFSKTSLDKWLSPLREHIREFHLHDNYGTDDDHLPIGRGNFSFRELKEFIRGLPSPHLYFVAEVHEESLALESIKNLREFLS